VLKVVSAASGVIGMPFTSSPGAGIRCTDTMRTLSVLGKFDTISFFKD
jgi:hypothetical protein